MIRSNFIYTHLTTHSSVPPPFPSTPQPAQREIWHFVENHPEMAHPTNELTLDEQRHLATRRQYVMYRQRNDVRTAYNCDSVCGVLCVGSHRA